MSDEKKTLVFLVDDDETYLEKLQYHIKHNSNFSVEAHSFTSAEACLENLDMNPDIIFMDYYLDSANSEAMNGLDAFKKINEVLPDVPTIIMSVQDRFGVVAETILEGVYTYIVKDNEVYGDIDRILGEIIGTKSGQV